MNNNGFNPITGDIPTQQWAVIRLPADPRRATTRIALTAAWLMVLGLLFLLTACSAPDTPIDATPTSRLLPTRASFRTHEADTPVEVLHVSETLLSVDLAAHPSANWPAVAAVAAPLRTDDDPRTWVRVFDPQIHRWRDALSLGSGDSAMAHIRFRTAQIGVAGDGRVLVVWGLVRNPRFGLVAAESTDYGRTWSQPIAIAARTQGIRDLAVAPSGLAAALAISELQQRPMLIRRSADGQWQPPEILPVPAWYGSVAALAITGDGQDAQIVAVTSGAAGTLYLLRRPFAGGTWYVERQVLPGPDERPAGIFSNLRALPLADDSVLFTIAMAERGAAYSLTALPGGGWSVPRLLLNHSDSSTPYLAAAEDASNQRSAILYTCCEDATFRPAESTHYLIWSQPDGSWQTSHFPFVTGAIAASDSATAQAVGTSRTWLAWIEGTHSVVIRSIDLAHQ